jgi:hypothetical protein
MNTSWELEMSEIYGKKGKVLNIDEKKIKKFP